MVSAAEHILQEEGYGNLTSRSVAEHIGVKQRLVYYYFHTMDDLIVETFRTLAVREIKRFEEAAASDHSLLDMWRVFADTADTKLVSEFMALANRSEALREQVTSHIETTRRLQIAAFENALARSGKTSSLPTSAAIIFANAAALAVHREAGLGVSIGHAEVLESIERFIIMHDPS
jgi:AcrR family transcriptional regulator